MEDRYEKRGMGFTEMEGGTQIDLLAEKGGRIRPDQECMINDCKKKIERGTASHLRRIRAPSLSYASRYKSHSLAPKLKDLGS